MIAALSIAAVVLALLLALFSFVQMLYLESLRLRAREQPALEFFKETLEERLGLETEKGAIAFSLIKHLSMVLLGPMVFGVAAAEQALGWAALAEAAVFTTALMLLSAYIVPQLLYRKAGARWLMPLAPALRAAAFLVSPLTSLFSFLESLAAINEPPESDEDRNGQADELEALIDAGADEGLIEEADRRLIQSVVELGDKTVREVMTARPNMVAVQQDCSIEEFRAMSLEKHYSRFPVYGESIDDIKGFIHIRDIIRLPYGERATHHVREFMRPIRFVPETKPVGDLLREMQATNTQMAIVVDEYGDTAGLATMEDVVEEVFGEIHDEYDRRAEVREEANGAYVISGTMDLDHLHELLEFRPGEKTESTTVGGLMTEWLGRVPEVGEVAERDGIRLEVTAADERHVVQLRVSRSREPEESEKNGEPNG